MVSSSSDESGVIKLEEDEQKIFDLLKNVVKELDLSTELRCAGGWVRDKLLGRKSEDIDIAVDNMTGESFANRFNEYLVSHGGEKSHVAVIQSNPDQSKHLETAKVKYQGLEIDFVNLRSESYASTSRIPEIEFGTAEQDATRRDFTINALFFNIRNGSVEDLTLKGLQDLRNHLIRTPLPALQTFLDDPLRVMRAIRFASRLNFELHQDIIEAASTSQVKDALETKVSRERIGTELEATLEGPNPAFALKLVRSFGLLDIVLNIPKDVRGDLPSGYVDPCINCAIFMADMLVGKVDKPKQKIGILSALLLPLRDFSAPADKKGNGKSLPEYLIGLCINKKKDAAMVRLLQQASCDMHSVAGCFDDVSSISDENKVKLGLAVRSVKELWVVASVLSYIIDLPFGVSVSGEDGAYSAVNITTEELIGKASEYISKVERTISSLKLDRAWEIKPLVNGKEVMKLLNAKGRIIGKAMGEIMNWQLSHPDGSIEECKTFLMGIENRLK